jgi:hypothetical protein
MHIALLRTYDCVHECIGDETSGCECIGNETNGWNYLGYNEPAHTYQPPSPARLTKTPQIHSDMRDHNRTLEVKYIILQVLPITISNGILDCEN